MNIRLILSATALAAASLTSAAVFAQAASAPLTADQREANQNARIKEGRASGDLTQRESKRLKAEQRIVKNKEKRVNADGVVTPAEQKRLDHMQTKASKDIHRQKNDQQTPAAK
eukprot:gene42296-biopygen33945